MMSNDNSDRNSFIISSRSFCDMHRADSKIHLSHLFGQLVDLAFCVAENDCPRNGQGVVQISWCSPVSVHHNSSGCISVRSWILMSPRVFRAAKMAVTEVHGTQRCDCTELIENSESVIFVPNFDSYQTESLSFDYFTFIGMIFLWFLHICTNWKRKKFALQNIYWDLTSIQYSLQSHALEIASYACYYLLISHWIGFMQSATSNMKKNKLT